MPVVKPHVSLNISNVDASVAFYEKVLGIPAAKRRPGYAKFDLQEPSLNLTTQETPRSLPAQNGPVPIGKKSGCR